MPFKIRKLVRRLNFVCFNLIEFNGIIEMNLNITLIIKNNAKILFIKEVKHFAYAPAELLAKSIFTY